MPTVTVDKEELYKSLGREYTTDEFRDLCFEFGIELEEDSSELLDESGKPLPGRPTLKIDIPANRYDLLCPEGIARALNIFQKNGAAPKYTTVRPPNNVLQKLIVKPETKQIRPFVVAAILRDITFDEMNYDNFIALQDKLHMNICRKRTLASMGTHDLDTIQGPFTYEALPPKEINFIPLNQSKSMDGEALMQFYEADKHLGKFLHIIRDSPVYPIIYDSKRTVLSLPPIINSDHSKITLQTKNVFIEVTATDLTKANIVVNTLVTMFSQYCKKPFTVEPVEVVYPDGTTMVTPDLTPRDTKVSTEYINSCTGLGLSASDIASLLNRMSLDATAQEDEIVVKVPPTRSDILHACDLMEDAAIAYGYNNLPRKFPSVNTFGSSLPVNKLADRVRMELALAGFYEVMPLILCSHDENFAFLNREDKGDEAIKLANPKTIEYQVVRTTLLPGVLKTISHNKKYPLPIKVFEVSEVAFKDATQDRLTRNERRVCAAYAGKTSGFEITHGLLNRIMSQMGVKLVDKHGDESGYWIEESANPTYFPGRSADVLYRRVAKAMGEVNGPVERSVVKVGSFGTIHPEVLQKFEIGYAVSALEFNLEVFLKQ
ncbi:uncharacterized protein VTP21DRAFT_2863 [Calcarisporiella thermophila]|uniref:uncharacterized protein n=1 Tax=Calcarisporiella thermophila TaxID=911321 RepID=UPI0037431B4A